jgi:hypothetical protein
MCSHEIGYSLRTLSGPVTRIMSASEPAKDGLSKSQTILLNPDSATSVTSEYWTVLISSLASPPFYASYMPAWTLPPPEFEAPKKKRGRRR